MGAPGYRHGTVALGRSHGTSNCAGSTGPRTCSLKATSAPASSNARITRPASRSYQNSWPATPPSRAVDSMRRPSRLRPSTCSSASKVRRSLAGVWGRDVGVFRALGAGHVLFLLRRGRLLAAAHPTAHELAGATAFGMDVARRAVAAEHARPADQRPRHRGSASHASRCTVGSRGTCTAVASPYEPTCALRVAAVRTSAERAT